MARIRSIKPEFWSDDKVGMLPRAVRLTFLGLISAMADDYGRMRGNPRVVRGAVYPMDDDITAADIAGHLEQLAAIGLVTCYEVAGEPYMQLVNWAKHQKIDRRQVSRLPPPPGWDVAAEQPPGRRPVDGHSSNGRRTVVEDSSNDRRPVTTEREREREREMDGEMEKERERRDSPNESSNASSKAATLFIRRFYLDLGKERRAEVEQQLAAALSPVGVRIRKGEYVRATSPGHLDRVLHEVINDPPKDPDKAIVFVLKKLCDPVLNAHGETSTEAQARLNKQSEASAAAEYRARKKRAADWMRDHPAEAKRLREESEEKTPGESDLAKVMREGWLISTILRILEGDGRTLVTPHKT